MASPKDNPNTTDSITVARPAAPKDWDEMSADEQAKARAAAAQELANADKPDPVRDREMDRVLGRMKEVFQDQKRHPVILYQISGAMKAAGQRELPPLEGGINGYNFRIPRGVPVELPEDMISVLYQAGEISPQTMLSMGLRTVAEIKADLEEQNAVSEMIANKIKPQEFN